MTQDPTFTSDRLEPVLAALHRGERPAAARLAAAAAADVPTSLVARHLAIHLAAPPSPHGVYVDPAAFRRFITTGGNVGLYEATSAALAARWPDGPFRLLDVGTGDGQALLPALEHARRADVVVDAVEPSVALAEELSHRAPQLRVHATGVEDFLATVPAGQRWHVGQATFALHSLAPADRTGVLAALARRCDRFVLVEFDVPRFSGQQDPARVAYCLRAYDTGLAEYEDQGDALVAQGFLLPVLLGGLDPDVAQTTWEQPAAAWVDELRAAGWASVDATPLCPYWWAPAVVVTAQGSPPA